MWALIWVCLFDQGLPQLFLSLGLLPYEKNKENNYVLCMCIVSQRPFITFKTVKSDDNVIFKQSIKAYVTFVLTILVWTRLDNFLFYFYVLRMGHITVTANLHTFDEGKQQWNDHWPISVTQNKGIKITNRDS